MGRREWGFRLAALVDHVFEVEQTEAQRERWLRRWLACRDGRR